MQETPRRRRRPRRGFFIVAFIVLFVASGAISRFYTDVLWFQEVGFSSVLWTSLTTQFGLGIGVALLTALVVWGNLRLAQALAPPYLSEISGRRDPLERYRQAFAPFVTWLRIGVAAFVGSLTGLRGGGVVADIPSVAQPGAIRRERSAVRQGHRFLRLRVAVLRHDDRLDVVHRYGVARHFHRGSFLPRIDPAGGRSARRVLGGSRTRLGAARATRPCQGRAVLARSVPAQLLRSWSRDGASYTDVHAQLPALKLLAVISIISAVLFLVNIWVRRVSLPLAAVGIWILTAFLAGGLWPLFGAAVLGEPSGARAGASRSSSATSKRREPRSGYPRSRNVRSPPRRTSPPRRFRPTRGCSRTSGCGTRPSCNSPTSSCRRSGPTTSSRTSTSIATRSVVSRARCCCRLASYRSTTCPRAPRRGRTSIFSTRTASDWSRVWPTPERRPGQPSFLVKDVPGTVVAGAESLEADQPRLYFGEVFEPDEYSIVNSRQDELDYPTESEVERSNYEGEGGIERRWPSSPRRVRAA